VTIWIDAQLSPLLGQWIKAHFGIQAIPVRELGLRDAKDIEIFRAAKEADVVVLTKDADFPHLLSQHGPPPQVLWLTCGNTSNAKLKTILTQTLPAALRLLSSGETLVEISDIRRSTTS
jgi:predicted nuclease of predicted toxin-antitoxin system